jgi:hypothetical protein
MYNRLGVHWASAVPGFLALACLPFPFLFHQYGHAVRKRCEYSADAMRMADELSKTTDSNVAYDTDEWQQLH